MKITEDRPEGESVKKNAFFYTTALVLFFIDIFSLNLFGQQTVSLLLCFYAIALARDTTIGRLFFCLFLLSYPPLILHGKFGLSLLYLLPLSILTLEAKNLITKTALLPYFFLILALICQEVLIHGYVLQGAFSYQFMLIKICVSLFVLFILEKLVSQR